MIFRDAKDDLLDVHVLSIGFNIRIQHGFNSHFAVLFFPPSSGSEWFRTQDEDASDQHHFYEPNRKEGRPEA